MAPDSVVWDLTPQMVSGQAIPRKDKFAADPLITGCVAPKAYVSTGYDKGHLYPYADAQCDSTDAVECFYMSNMLPQLHTLNAGDWKTIEEYERQLAATQSIHILAGGIGSIGKTKSGLNIPQKCWKAIYSDGKWLVWIMPNTTEAHGHDVEFWKSTIAELDLQTGLHL